MDLLDGQTALRNCGDGECCHNHACEELHEQILQIEAVHVALRDLLFEDPPKITLTQVLSIFHNHVSYSIDGETWTKPLTHPLLSDARDGWNKNDGVLISDYAPRYTHYWPYCVVNNQAAHDAKEFYRKRGEDYDVPMLPIDPERFANKTTEWEGEHIVVADTMGLGNCDKEHVKLGFVYDNRGKDLR